MVAVTARRLGRALAAGAALAAAALAACGRAAADAAGPARGASDRAGTARMADTLAALNEQARAQAMDVIFLNRERVASLRARLAGRTGPETFNTRHQLADELLRAGQPREAIAELEALMREAGVSADTITRQMQPVFDLLAVAYLRLGEQENCLANPGADVCILPLKGAGRHVHQAGARGAIARYTRLLHFFPDDHGARYLLNVAWMAVGGYPDSVPARYRIAALAPRGGNAFPVYPNVAGAAGLAVTGLAGGVVVDDLNRDGLLDVFTTAQGLNDPVHVLLADGGGAYTDRTASAGLRGIVGGLNTVQADYDNDGDVDLLVLRGGWMGEQGRFPVSLLRNRGDGTFADVTFGAGLASFHPSQTAAWGDFNLDGHLDLFVGREGNGETGGASHRSELFLNNGNGTFTEVAGQVGITLDAFVKGVVWTDVDDDGLPDLYVSVLNGPNRLYMNRGPTAGRNWHFESRGAAAGVEAPSASFPVLPFDYDNDGREDLLVLSYDLRGPLHEGVAREYLGLPRTQTLNGQTVPIEGSRLYRNRGDGTFEDATARAGLDGKVIYAMGTNFGDLDNDGWLDVYVGTGNPDLRSVIPNRMFRNAGGRRFDEVTLPGGFGHLQKGHAVAFADLDRDGDQDVFAMLGGAFQGDRFASVLFENPGWPRHAWLGLELEGRTANRSAIGARVEVEVEGPDGATRRLWRTVRSGGSFGASPLALHVGLGPAARVRTVRVRWPDGARTTTAYADLAPNRSYRITQGTAAPVALDRPPVRFRAGSRAEHTHAGH